MQLDTHIQAIQADLAASASLGDEAAAEAGQRLIDALAATLHLRLLDLLGEAVAELGPQLEAGRIEVRLSGREPELAYVADEAPDVSPAAPGEEYTGRISLRLPEALKVAVETAAGAEGLSVNAWLVKTIARTLESRPRARHTRHRLQGFAQG